MYGESFATQRSFCPKCRQTLAWYDLVPVISWLLLGRKCRFCKACISYLYPFIELLTTLLLLGVYYRTPAQFFLAHFILASALLVSIRTDLETMLISRYVTLFLIPSVIPLAYLHLLPIPLLQSVLGALSGYLVLWGINKFFFLMTKKEGIGQGDMDLLALIGAFTGPLGCWITILMASITGSIIGIISTLAYKKTFQSKIPFGPFLALGAFIYLFFNKELLLLLI